MSDQPVDDPSATPGWPSRYVPMMAEGTDVRLLVDQDEVRAFRQTVTYELGGYLYEMPVVAQCKMCRSPFRAQVESAVIRGFTYKAIAEGLPEEANLTWRNIADHTNSGHMPLRERAKRIIIEQRAKDLALDLDEAAATLVDHITLAKVGVQRVFERMAAGELDPDIDDGIQFARLLVQIDQQAGGGVALTNEVMRDLFMAYAEVIGHHCNPEQMAKIRNDLMNHPVLQRVREQQEGAKALGVG